MERRLGEALKTTVTFLALPQSPGIEPPVTVGDELGGYERDLDSRRGCVQVAAASTACNSSARSSIGLPFVLLAWRALATISPACSGVSP